MLAVHWNGHDESLQMKGHLAGRGTVLMVCVSQQDTKDLVDVSEICIYNNNNYYYNYYYYFINFLIFNYFFLLGRGKGESEALGGGGSDFY